MNLVRSLRSGENFHIVLWLMKDVCWVQDWKIAGAVMLVPTLAMAIWITWRSRLDLCELLHSLAVVFWIAANGTWMLGEFYCNDCTRPYAMAFFVLGLVCVARWYLWPRVAIRTDAAGGE
ncbi:MAG: hypothetical protein WAU70_05045 [Flavobacteriales bacterium]